MNAFRVSASLAAVVAAIVLGPSTLMAQGSPLVVKSSRPASVVAPPLQVSRDLALEQTVSLRSQMLTAALQPSAKAKLDLASLAVFARLASGRESTDPYLIAQQEIGSRFAGLTPEQSNVLALSVLSDQARLLANPGALKQQLESLGEMSAQNLLRLQANMDRMSKLMVTLSNLMKNSSATSASIIQNLK